MIQINLNAALHIQQLFCFTLWRTVRICNHNYSNENTICNFSSIFFRCCCCYCFRFIVFFDKNSGDGGDSDGSMSMVRWCYSVWCWCFLFGCQSCLWKCSPGCIFLCGLTGRESNRMCATSTVQKAFESLIILRQFTVHNRDTTHIDRTIFTFIQRPRHSFFCLHWK